MRLPSLLPRKAKPSGKAAKLTDTGEFSLSVHHTHFTPIFYGADQPKVAPDLLRTYLADPNWAKIFHDRPNNLDMAANDMLGAGLAISRRTLRDCVTEQAIEEFRATKSAKQLVEFPLLFEPNFMSVKTVDGPRYMKEVRVACELRMRPWLEEARYIKYTDDPFIIFSTEADRDYILARMLHYTGTAFITRTAFFANQALEKYLKAISVQYFKRYKNTHDLIELAAIAAEAQPYFTHPQLLKNLHNFNEYREVGRYGGAANFDPRAGKFQGRDAFGVLMWPENNLEILDGTVHRMRSYLEYNEHGLSDPLKAILEGNKSSQFSGTWTLDTSLKSVLTRDNNLFKDPARRGPKA
jgi:HEPN domain-containing protein